jgi:hypothetical protein
MVRAPASILGNASYSRFGHTTRSTERRAKKGCGRPLGTKDGRQGPGREEAMTMRPDLAISAMRCFPLVAVFGLILRPS